MSLMDFSVVPSSDDFESAHELPQLKSGIEPQDILVGGLLPHVYRSEADEMTFSSSPVLYPASSSPAPVLQKAKRKLFQSFTTLDPVLKRPRIVGGFEVDDDEGDEGDLDAQSEMIGDNALQGRASACTESVELPQTGTISPNLVPIPAIFTSRMAPKKVEMQTTSGRTLCISTRTQSRLKSYEQIIAQRSTNAEGRAKTAYYGIDIHKLIDEAKIQRELDEASLQLRRETEEVSNLTLQEAHTGLEESSRKHSYTQMWTEKYRAKKFTELVGDERTHRSVLRWLKSWDATVFPGMAKLKPKRPLPDQEQEKQHRKVLLLTGPPGLGKTTLAHVCAKQAGYEVLEINASDDRSRDVVRGRIKDVLGTETVRGIQENGKARRAGRPVCVVVDEVDGVVSGTGGSGGEGGFMKALIDLVHLDQRNSNGQSNAGNKKKGDRFRQMRPLIMICNDVYAPSLRPLRQSGLAEIIHVRKPALDKVIARLKTVFEKESISCDNDAVRRLCESSWGLGTRKQNSLSSRGSGDGDIRGILVQGEWAAHKLRSSDTNNARLTRKWVEEHLGESSSSQKGLGRGGVREVVERVFIEGAGMPNIPTKLNADDARLVSESKINPVGVADIRKRAAIGSLREMINACGEHDRLMTDLFSAYPTQVFQDDNFLSKPNASYEWLNFHDRLSSRIYTGQEWELNAYLSTSACGFHDLFAAVDKGSRPWNDEKPTGDEVEEDTHPFSGLKADFAAREAEKASRTILTEMQSNFSASLLRLFSSVDAIATELVPSVARMLAPEIKPVVVGGGSSGANTASVRKESEKTCVKNAVRVMHNLGIEFEKIRIEHEGGGAHSNGGYALRMEPPLDTLTTYHFDSPSSTTEKSGSRTSSSSSPLIATAPAPVRYAIRQVLAQELAKEKVLQASLTRQARVSTLPSASNSILDQPSITPTTIRDNDSEANKENQPQRISTQDLIASKSRSLLNAIGNKHNVKRDFFGRPILQRSPSQGNIGSNSPLNSGINPPQRSKHARTSSTVSGTDHVQGSGQRIWVSFHEGYSNAVRKYVSLNEFMDGF